MFTIREPTILDVLVWLRNLQQQAILTYNKRECASLFPLVMFQAKVVKHN